MIDEEILRRIKPVGAIDRIHTAQNWILARTTDAETKAHRQASRDEIAKILDPKFAPPAPVAATTAGGRGGE